jgi:hypothetical protein
VTRLESEALLVIAVPQVIGFEDRACRPDTREVVRQLPEDGKLSAEPEIYGDLVDLVVGDLGRDDQSALS